MREWWKLSPPIASNFAGEVDLIYWSLWGMTLFFSLLIALLIFIFMIKYRRSRRPFTPPPTRTNLKLEIAWLFIPLIGGMSFFAWGAKPYLDMYAVAPPKSYEVFVTGKRWMWKLQHPTGQREINELHIPVNRPVKLIMISQDVIHSFFVPAFRIKHDVLPMSYSQIWFTPTMEGSFHLFCAEYCGTAHSGMIGKVVVLNQGEFETWLQQAPTEGAPAVSGDKVLTDLGCRACHAQEGTAIGPKLEGIFGKPVQLQDGSTVVADENYIRESILNSGAKIVANYQPVMPPYMGRISEDQLMAIIAYIKSTGEQE